MSAGGNAPTKKSILTCLAILAAITVIEVLFAFMVTVWKTIDLSESMWVFKSVMIVMSSAKAYFIVNEFMHMKYEKKSFVFYTLVSLPFLFWFIIAMLYEGNSYKLSRMLEFAFM